MTSRKATPPAKLVQLSKKYDEAYYERWYRSSRRVVTPGATLRKARLALAAAEFVLGREVRSVLDVGCGEGLWRRILKKARPNIAYTGVDSSEYVVRRYGKRRNIVLGTLGSLHQIGLRGKFDLIICVDVAAYIPTPELQRGLTTMRRLARGIAYIDAYTVADEFVGDLDGWHHRSEATYRSMLAKAGLVACGLNCWMPRSETYRMSALEMCG
jgi:SAM-dependent methyltransferase